MKWMEVTVVLSLCFITYCSAYTTCKELGKVVGVKVNNVAQKPNENTPVSLHKGANATLEVTFIPSIDTSLENSKCYGIIGGVPVPFPVHKNGCDNIKPGCPLKAAQTYTFTTDIEVKKIYPSIRLIIKWEEQDQNGGDTFCLLITAVIGS